jgi:CRISPR system Cascade subunit CasE
MFLSKLIVDIRCRVARADLSAPYEMHRTLMRAFPDSQEGGPGRVLFRLDDDRQTGEVFLLVQSDKAPDWERLPNGYLTVPAYCKQIDLTFHTGQRLLFRLRANPTVKRDGKRLGLLSEHQQRDWLARKAQAGGFRVLDCLAVSEGFQCGQKSDARLTLLAVRFEGVLEVSEPGLFATALGGGIGSAKGLGFGLLSLARAEG